MWRRENSLTPPAKRLGLRQSSGCFGAPPHLLKAPQDWRNPTPAANSREASYLTQRKDDAESDFAGDHPVVSFRHINQRKFLDHRPHTCQSTEPESIL